MNHKYLPHTEQEISSMLSSLGLTALDDLFSHLPAAIRFQDYGFGAPQSDSEVRASMQSLSGKPLIPFRGYGAYDHERPAIVEALSSRQEFLTSYTPYQPEVSQGTLQYIFEFQTLICELTGLDVSNASMYDGATSAAEAMMMAVNHTNCKRVLVSDGILPHVLNTLKTYAHFRGVTLEVVASSNGIVANDELTKAVQDPFAAFITPYPNRFGIIEHLDTFSDIVHAKNGLLIVYADLLALTLFKTPGKSGADITCGDAQSLGLPLAFGGPYLGYLATLQTLVRKMPGRICGMTKDNRGQRAYVLTLQAREQHIRRDKANSNICSNQSLLALQAMIYAATMGKQGLTQVAMGTIKATRYLFNLLIGTTLFTPVFKAPFAFEVTLDYVGDLGKLNSHLENRGYLGPMPLSEHRGVFYASEKQTKQTLDDFVAIIKEIDHEIR
jgi:glycine dehydrogenase subunit 1